MTELGLVLKKLLRRKKMWTQYSQHLILERWAEIVGPRLAAVTRAEKICQGTLFITVKDSIWSYHLTLLKLQLLDQINSYAGAKVVQEIYFRVGDLNWQEMDSPAGNYNEQNDDHGALKDCSSGQSFLNQIRRLKLISSLNRSVEEDC